MNSSVAAIPSTWGPIRIPKSSSKTTAGGARRAGRATTVTAASAALRTMRKKEVVSTWTNGARIVRATGGSSAEIPAGREPGRDLGRPGYPASARIRQINLPTPGERLAIRKAAVAEAVAEIPKSIGERHVGKVAAGEVAVGPIIGPLDCSSART